MKILWLSHWFPYPPDNGARLRTYHLMRQLAGRHEIALLSFAEQPPEPAHLEALAPICRVLEALPRPTFRRRSLRSLAGYFAPMPRYLIDTHSPAMANALKQQLATDWPQVIVASEIGPATGMSHYALQTPSRPRLVEDLELLALQDRWRSSRQLRDRLTWGLRWWKTTNYVRKLLREFDGCTVASQEEQDCLTGITGAANSGVIIPNGVEPDFYRDDFGPPDPDTLIFSGALSFHFNFEAMTFFLSQIFPRIRAQRPGVTLRITGSTQGVPLHQLPQQPGVEFTGYVDDIRPVIARSWVSVAPLRRGGGTRLKVLEAMALGTPVVSTGKGAEGIKATPGQNLLIADNADEFAKAVVSLLENPELRQTLSCNGRKLVKDGYNWENIGQQFEAALYRLVKGSE